MKKNNYKKLHIPQKVDERVFGRLEHVFAHKIYQNPIKSFFFGKRLTLFSSAFIFLVVSIYAFSPSPYLQYATAAEGHLRHDIQQVSIGERIRYQKITFIEGVDKNEVTKKLFPDFEIRIDNQRQDIIEQWSNKNTQYTVVLSNVSTIPVQSYIYHENLYHFNHNECPDTIDTCITKTLIDNAENSRNYLDQAHDIATLYTENISHSLNHDDIFNWLESMEFLPTVTIDARKYAKYSVVHDASLSSILFLIFK